jgi:hypothetical protein
MMSNSGKRITFYGKLDLFGKAVCKSISVEKAVKGLQHTGIWPFDENKFTDDQFAAAEVTDEPLPQITGELTASDGN